MRDQEKGEFSAVLSAALEVFGRPITPASVGVWWEVLKRYDIGSIRSALSKTVASSRFPPTPADVISAIGVSDGRPSAAEAWAVAVESLDERNTVVWTDEAREAFGFAQQCFDVGDKYGARLAFVAAYDRLVAEARAAGRPVRWAPSLGWDVSLRESALRSAEAQNLLPRAEVEKLLPAPKEIGPLVTAIVGGDVPRLQDLRPEDRQTALKHLDKIREILKGKESA